MALTSLDIQDHVLLPLPLIDFSTAHISAYRNDWFPEIGNHELPIFD